MLSHKHNEQLSQGTERRHGKKKRRGTNNIGIKYGFSCINIRQVLREVFITEAGGRGFQHLPRDLANVDASKNHVQSLLLHKKLALFCFAFSPISRDCSPRTMLVLGPGSTHLVTAANLWPRYDHIGSCVAMH